MKTLIQQNTPNRYLLTPNKSWAGLIAMAMAMVVCATGAMAQSLTWDAGTAHTGTGSGNWDTTTANWWNGSADVGWPQTSTTVATSGAVFGNGVDQPDGTYGINVDAQVAVTNIIFNNTGYNLTNSSGAGIYFNNASAGAVPGGVFVAAGKTADYNVPTAGQSGIQSGDVCFGAGAGATLNINGVAFATAFQPCMFGPGTNVITGGTFPVNQLTIHGPVVYNGGSGQMNYSGSLFIGYAGNGPGSFFGTSASAAGSFTMNSGTFADSNSKFILARGGGTGSFILNGGTVNFWVNGANNGNSIIALPNNDISGNHGTLLVNGGTFNIGSSSTVSGSEEIQMMSGGGANGETAFFTQTGGVVNDWGGILVGNTGSSAYSATCTAAITNSGGSLFIGSPGIIKGLTVPTVIYIQLSGGIVGALAAWSSVLPVDLDTANGNITFQCANSSAIPFNISLSGALTGPGGLNKTGTGTLQLSGANNFAGSTVVSNGTLKIVTGTLPTASGPNILDGSAGGSPIESVNIQNTGQYWTNNGDLTYAAGTMTADFNNNAFIPSSVTAPIQVSGNVNFTATPSVTIEGTAIPKGKFPLIQYGGTVNNPGNMPATPTLPGYASGYISNSVTAKIIYLVVTNSTVNPPLVWSTNSGAWDFTSFNWKQSGSPVQYADGSFVQFDDSWTNGSFSVTVTNNGTVNPAGITISTTNAYTLTGNGTIAGAGSVTMVSSGTLTMAGTNTYSGGTLIQHGQININYGGDGSANSAIGTGPLTNDLGSIVDNTSGHSVTLLTPIAQYWNDDWTFKGSTNYNTGPGAVTLGNNNVFLTVVSNNLEVDGSISDNGNGYKITKQGNGSLTLKGSGSSYTGGFEVFAGQVNLGDASSCGYGAFTIDAGAIIDNVSGGNLMISPGSIAWSGNFSYLGTSNNLDFGSGLVTASFGIPIYVNVANNTLITEGNVFAGNNVVHKTGQGTWDIAGFGSSGQDLSLNVDQGTVMLDKSSGQSVNNFGLVVQSNSLAIITGSDGDQIADTSPVILNTGGVLDLNGNSEAVGSLTNNNGVLRNSLAGSSSGFTNSATTLTGANCVFDVSNSAAMLNIYGIVTGGGTLVKTGLGTVSLLSSNSYTGNVTVNSGTLTLTYPDLTTNATVTLATGAVLNLNYTNGPATDVVNALVLGGTNQPTGIYNASTSPTFITGSGSLQVGIVSAPLTSLAFTTSPVISGTSLTISVTNAGAGTVYLLSSTNVAAPLNTWTPVWTNVLGGSGSFTTNLLNVVNPALLQQFYLLSNTNN